MICKEKFLDTLKKLVSAPSISGTEKENVAAKKIFEMILEIPYFQINKDLVEMVDIVGDPFNRKFVSAFYKSPIKTTDTVIITGHLDVVDVEDFGHLKEIAFNVDKYTSRVKELLHDTSSIKDLESGNYLFGRGTADMKYGIALCIEILREVSANPNYNGNILFLAVPGEESNSEGMLAVAPYIRNLIDKHNYNFLACCVTECAIPRWNGDETKRIYTGTVGKVMPLFFVVGKETHVCDSLSGINPNLIISEINRLMEINADFCDFFMNESNPPPTCLKQTDLKDLYNVQTPLYAVSYYNLLTLRATGKDLMEKLQNLSYNAFNNVIEIIKDNANKFRNIANQDILEMNFSPCIMTFKEMFDKVNSITFGQFDKYIDNKVLEWQSSNLNNQTIAINIIRETYENYPDKKPMIIISFAPPYYPHKHLDNTNEKEFNLSNAIDHTITYANEKFNLKMEKEHFYKAICDLSYTGIKDIESVKDILANMPSLNKSYNLPIDDLLNINIPGIVFGGYGKDFHKNSERISVPYSFDIVPELYLELLKKIFEK